MMVLMGYFGGITLRSGRRGFAVCRDGKRLSPSTPIHSRAGISIEKGK